MNLLLRFGLIIIIFLVFTKNADSQKIATPLEPEISAPIQEIGLILGLGANFQSGTFLVECEDCFFENGTGFGFNVGVVYEVEFIEKFRFGSYAAYNNMSIESTYREREAIDVEDLGKVPIWFRHFGKAKFSYLDIVPYLKWKPANFFFLRAGAGISYVLGSNLTHTQKALDDKVFHQGQWYNVNIVNSDDNTVVNEDHSFPEVNKLQLAFKPAIGFNFDLGNWFYLSPVFEYSIPFSSPSEQGIDFRINSWRITFELRHDFTGGGEVRVE